jgi:hypothetical protein
MNMAIYTETSIGFNGLTDSDKSKTHITVEIIEYLPNSMVRKTTIMKSTENISVTSLNSYEGLSEKTTSSDTFAQIIDGYAEIVIAGESYFLETGQAIIIPAYAPCFARPNSRFKMILTVIKNGFD